ncbi:hypothetical protein [Chryseobacterium aureum]|uniref:hypothetical protein n=1 Tax=Chryseobacterium aureum TaxID=2497456 RepID=UPI000F88E55A|nr:hypothetical protein [Chryseobacterium aureum]
MPKNEQGEVKCINNDNHEMHIEPERLAMLNVTKSPTGENNIDANKFVPVQFHVCKECGYVELYFSPM